MNLQQFLNFQRERISQMRYYRDFSDSMSERERLLTEFTNDLEQLVYNDTTNAESFDGYVEPFDADAEPVEPTVTWESVGQHETFPVSRYTPRSPSFYRKIDMSIRDYTYLIRRLYADEILVMRIPVTVDDYMFTHIYNRVSCEEAMRMFGGYEFYAVTKGCFPTEHEQSYE